MKNTFVILSVLLFICYSTITLSQQTYIVDIPGENHYVYFDPNNSQYHEGQFGLLHVGFNAAINRSYIYWPNIRSYVPSGSQIIETKFFITWSGAGYSSAILNFRDFTLSTDPETNYHRIGYQTIVGTYPATTNEYSIIEITSKVQNAVDGGNNNV